MRATLESLGHTAEVASDGSYALERALAEAFDVIICDLRMPHLSGRDMYTRLARQDPRAAERIIFATGDTVRGDTLQFLERLGRPYLHKPFTLLSCAAPSATPRSSRPEPAGARPPHRLGARVPGRSGSGPAAGAGAGAPSGCGAAPGDQARLRARAARRGGGGPGVRSAVDHRARSARVVEPDPGG